MKKLYTLGVFVGLCFGLRAQTHDSLTLWLPPAEVVQSVVLNSHAMAAAASQQAAQLHRASATQAGSDEFNLRMSQQNRRTSDPAARFAEQQLSVERSVRWWGKSGLDAKLAEHSRALAGLAYAQALHESGRELMRQWFALHQLAWAREASQAQTLLSQMLHQQTQLRLKHGDISQLDANLAQAELQRAQAAQAVSQAQWAAGRAQFQKRYPGLPDPAWPSGPMDVPQLPALQAALQSLLDKHPELNLRRAEVQGLRLQAERMDRDRLPDPVFGVFMARERGGAENTLGVSVGFALSGPARQAQASAALADALQLEAQVRQMTLDVAADFEARWLNLHLQRQVLQDVQAAAHTQNEAVATSLKAFAMGEHSMTELIQNRRLAQESLREHQRLQLEWMQAWALLNLELHTIWDFDKRQEWGAVKP